MKTLVFLIWNPICDLTISHVHIEQVHKGQDKCTIMKSDKEIPEKWLPFFVGIVENTGKKSMLFRIYKNSGYILKFLSVAPSTIPGIK